MKKNILLIFELIKFLVVNSVGIVIYFLISLIYNHIMGGVNGYLFSIPLSIFVIFGIHEFSTFSLPKSRKVIEFVAKVIKFYLLYLAFSLLFFIVAFFYIGIWDDYQLAQLNGKKTHLLNLFYFLSFMNFTTVNTLFWICCRKFIWNFSVYKNGFSDQRRNIDNSKQHYPKSFHLNDDKQFLKKSSINEVSQNPNENGSQVENQATLDLAILVYLYENETASFTELLEKLSCDRDVLENRLRVLQKEEYVIVVSLVNNEPVYKML